MESDLVVERSHPAPPKILPERLLPLIPVTQHVERHRDQFASDAGAFGLVRVQPGSATRGQHHVPETAGMAGGIIVALSGRTGSGALFDDVAVAGVDAERGVEGGAGSNGTRTRRGSGANGRAAGRGKCRAPSVSGSRRRDGSTSARDGRAFRRRLAAISACAAMPRLIAT